MPVNNGSDLVLYYHPYSFYSQKVIMSLHQKNLKFRPYFVDILKGKQFNQKFLSLNPKGEVPVLVDDVRVIPDSEQIINYLDDNFTNGSPRLRPSDPDLRQRSDELNKSINQLKVDALTFGSALYDDLELNPKPPYNNVANRSQIKSLVENRASILRQEIVKYPEHSEHLNKKLQAIKDDTALFHNRDKYEDLILSFERIMDECEAELQSHHENSTFWLCSPNISIADISFSLLLHRLWLLGFERKMWEKNRPFVKRYFARVQQLESFKKATSIPESGGLTDIVSSPFFWGFVGMIALAGGGYYLWNKNQWNTSLLFRLLSNSEKDSPSGLTSKKVSSSGPVSSDFGRTSGATGGKGYAFGSSRGFGYT